MHVPSILSLRSVLAASFLLAACGGGDGGTSPDPDPDPDPSDDGTMTATVDGAAWTGTAALGAEVDLDVPGGYLLEGTADPGLASRTIQIALYYVDGPGIYPLGVTASVEGGLGTVQRSGGLIWQSPASGDAGSVTVTELSTTRIKGTFRFTGVPIPGSNATGPIEVTGGAFDLPIEGTPRIVTSGDGRVFTATLGDRAYNAASVGVTVTQNNLLLSTRSTLHEISLNLAGFSGVGSYPLSMSVPVRAALVLAGSGGPTDSNCCWGAQPSDTGTITITRFDTDRVVGSFEVVLQPQAGSPAGTALTITNGAFDVGRQEP